MQKRIYASGAGQKYLALQNAAMCICIYVALNFYTSHVIIFVWVHRLS